MKKNRILILLIILFSTAVPALAQHPHGQFWTPELRINPAFTGMMNAKWRIRENYRRETFNDGYVLKWNTLSADIRKDITKEVGGYGLKMQESSGNTFGFGILDDRRRSDSAEAEYIADYFAISYHKVLKKSGNSIGFGIQPGYMRNASERKFDLNAGILWGKGKINCWQEDQYFQNQIGFAGYNLLSDWNDSSALPSREVHAHAGFLIKKIEQFNFVINGFYRYNGSNDFSIGTYALFFPIVHYAYWDRARLGLHYRSSNHLTLSAGLRLYGRGKKSITLDGTISYDLPLKFLEFNSTYKSAWEIGLVLIPFEKCWSLGKCGN